MSTEGKTKILIMKIFMFFNTHFPRISAVQLQQPRLHWVVTSILYHNICEVGEGPRVRAMLSDFYLGRKGHKNSDFGIEPYDLNETLCVGRS